MAITENTVLKVDLDARDGLRESESLDRVLAKLEKTGNRLDKVFSKLQAQSSKTSNSFEKIRNSSNKTEDALKKINKTTVFGKLNSQSKAANDHLKAVASNAKKTEDALKKVGKTSSIPKIGRDSRKAANDVNYLSKSTGGLGSKLLNLKNIIAGGIFAGLARTAVGAIDGLKNVNALLNIVSTSTADFKRTQLELFQVAQNSYASIKDTTRLYAGQAKQLATLGYEHAQQIKAVDLFGKALVTSGATTAEASAATLQWVQALGSGVLRGQEFNSIMENGRGVAIALADGLHTTIGNLRNMALEGKLSAKIVVDALLSQNDAIRDKFAKIPITIGKAWQQMRNSATVALSKVNDAIGDATGGIANFISKIAKSIDSVDFDKIITGAKIFSVILASRLLPAIVSTITRLSIVNLALAGYAVRTTIAAGATAMLSRGMALLGGPIGIIALVVGSFIAFKSSSDSATKATIRLRAQNKAIQSTIENVTALTHKATAASYANVDALRAQAKASRELELAQANSKIIKARVRLSAIDNNDFEFKGDAWTGSGQLQQFNEHKNKLIAEQTTKIETYKKSLAALEQGYKDFDKELAHTEIVQAKVNGGEAEAIAWKKRRAIEIAKEQKNIVKLLAKTKQQALTYGKTGVELAKLSPIYKQMTDKQQKSYLASIRQMEGLKKTKSGVNGVISEYDKLVGSMTKTINKQTLSHLEQIKLTKAYKTGNATQKTNLEILAKQQDALGASKIATTNTVKAQNSLIDSNKALTSGRASTLVDLEKERLGIGKNELALYKLNLEQLKYGKDKLKLSDADITYRVGLKANNIALKKQADLIASQKADRASAIKSRNDELSSLKLKHRELELGFKLNKNLTESESRELDIKQKAYKIREEGVQATKDAVKWLQSKILANKNSALALNGETIAIMRQTKEYKLLNTENKKLADSAYYRRIDLPGKSKIRELGIQTKFLKDQLKYGKKQAVLNKKRNDDLVKYRSKNAGIIAGINAQNKALEKQIAIRSKITDFAKQQYTLLIDSLKAGDSAQFGRGLANNLLDAGKKSGNAIIKGLSYGLEVVGALFSKTLSQAEIANATGRSNFADNGLKSLVDLTEKTQYPMLDLTRKMSQNLSSMDNKFTILAQSASLRSGVDISGLSFEGANNKSRTGASTFNVGLLSSGLVIATQNIEKALSGFDIKKYTTTKTSKSSWFGLRNRQWITKNIQDLDSATKEGFQSILSSGVDIIIDSSKTLGLDIRQQLLDYNISIGKNGMIDFKDLDQSEIKERLNQVFSEIFTDSIDATDASGLVNMFARIGESSLETLGRIAVEYEQASYSMYLAGALARKSLDVMGDGTNRLAGILTSQESVLTITKASGGIDKFNSNMKSFVDGFYDEAERVDIARTVFNDAFKAITSTSIIPDTKVEFRKSSQ